MSKHCKSCDCICREREQLSILLDSSRELSKKRVEFENLFDTEVLIFDGILDSLADCAKVLLGITDDHKLDELYMTFFNYSFHDDVEKEETIETLIGLM